MDGNHQSPSFPPPMPHSMVDHEARSRIGALEADMRGLRNQVDSLKDSVEIVRDNQGTMQAGLASANTNLEWLRKHHERQDSEKSNKPDPLSNNKVLLAIIGVMLVLANVVERLVVYFTGM